MRRAEIRTTVTPRRRASALGLPRGGRSTKRAIHCAYCGERLGVALVSAGDPPACCGSQECRADEARDGAGDEQIEKGTYIR